MLAWLSVYASDGMPLRGGQKNAWHSLVEHRTSKSVVAAFCGPTLLE